MRNTVLILLLLGLLLLGGGAFLWFVSFNSGLETEPALSPGAGDPQAAAPTEPAPLAGDLPPSPSVVPGTGLGEGERRFVEGVVLDRFGLPVAGERVFLLPGDQEHPSVAAQVADYPTALSSSEGRFVLTAYGPGPWRIGIGPPGAPRIPPSAPQSVTESIRVEVVVPGTAAARVLLDGLPATEESVVLELLALNEPKAPPPTPIAQPPISVPGDPVPERLDPDEQAKLDADQKAAQESGEEEDEEGQIQESGLRSSRQAQGGPPRPGSATGASLLPPDRSGPPSVSPAGPGVGGGVPPSRETWRALHRHRISEEELAEGVVGFGDLPVGEILRLRARVGRTRIEGARRFTPRQDSLTEVRILSLSQGPGATLDYLTSLEVLSSEDAPPGVRWLK